MALWVGLVLTAAQAAAPTPPVPRPDLVVFAVSEAGALLVEGWWVRVGARAGGSIRWQAPVRIDQEAGSVSFEGLDSATCFVELLHSTGESGGPEQIALAPEGCTVHELVFDGPLPERSLMVDVVRPRSTPVALAPDGGLIAVDHAGREQPLVAHPSIPERFVAHDVPPGVYRVEARDPRFATGVLDVLVPGTATRATLNGSASVVVRFVDADDRTPVWPSACTVRAQLESTQSSTSSSYWPFKPQLRSEGAAAGVLVAGFLPGTRVTLGAEFAEHVDATVEVHSLQPEERRTVECVVRRGRVVTGLVVDPSGAPVAGVPLVSEVEPRNTIQRVRGLRGLGYMGGPGALGSNAPVSVPPVLSSQQVVLGGSPPPPLAATSDSAGAFRLLKVPDDIRRVHAVLSPWHVVTVPIEGDVPPRVTALGQGGVDIELVLPDAVDLAGTSLALQVADGPWLTHRSAALIDDSGCLRLRGMPLTECRLWVRRPAPGPPTAPAPGDCVLTFVPSAGAPTRAVFDLSPLAPRR